MLREYQMHGQNSRFRPSSRMTNDEAKPSPSACSRVAIMSTIPEDLKYTAEHEWVNIENEIATIGITDYAQDALTDVVWVELPMIGDKVESMEPFASVESVKSVSEIYAPLSGEVIEVNEDLEAAPETINNDPYGDGWICRIKLDTKELSGLLNHEDYRSLLGE